VFAMGDAATGSILRLFDMPAHSGERRSRPPRKSHLMEFDVAGRIDGTFWKDSLPWPIDAWKSQPMSGSRIWEGVHERHGTRHAGSLATSATHVEPRIFWPSALHGHDHCRRPRTRRHRRRRWHPAWSAGGTRLHVDHVRESSLLKDGFRWLTKGISWMARHEVPCVTWRVELDCLIAKARWVRDMDPPGFFPLSAVAI
jgi:hypothetical protein